MYGDNKPTMVQSRTKPAILSPSDPVLVFQQRNSEHNCLLVPVFSNVLLCQKKKKKKEKNKFLANIRFIFTYLGDRNGPVQLSKLGWPVGLGSML